MPARQTLSDYRLAIDDLDRAILTLAGRINAATYELLVLIREFDEKPEDMIDDDIGPSAEGSVQHKNVTGTSAEVAPQHKNVTGASAEGAVIHNGKCVRESGAPYWH